MDRIGILLVALRPIELKKSLCPVLLSFNGITVFFRIGLEWRKSCRLLLKYNGLLVEGGCSSYVVVERLFSTLSSSTTG